MTEIPEHLLKRSRERRSATGGAPDEGGDAGSSAPAASASAPAVTTSAAPAAPAPTAPPAPAPPKPDPAHIAAAKARPRIPYWAMGTLALLPVFLFMYVRGLTPQEAEPAGPIAIGVETYGSCSSCHGADGQGGAGRPFVNGEVLLTFPHIEDQLNFVYAGTEGYEAAGMTTYGDPEREGGARVPRSFNGAPMPSQGANFGGALTESEILGVVCHIRYDLAGADSGGDFASEFEEWCSPESGVFAGLNDGSLTFDSIEGLGTEPRPGTPAGEPVGE